MKTIKRKVDGAILRLTNALAEAFVATGEAEYVPKHLFKNQRKIVAGMKEAVEYAKGNKNAGL